MMTRVSLTVETAGGVRLVVHGVPIDKKYEVENEFERMLGEPITLKESNQEEERKESNQEEERKED